MTLSETEENRDLFKEKAGTIFKKFIYVSIYLFIAFN